MDEVPVWTLHVAGTSASAILEVRVRCGVQDLSNRRTRIEARMVDVAVVAPLRSASMASSLTPRSSGRSMSLSVTYWLMR